MAFAVAAHLEPDGLLAAHLGDNGWDFFIDRFVEGLRVAGIAGG